MTERKAEYKTNTLSEHDEQAALIQWAHISERDHPELMNLYAVPNGTYTTPASAAKAHAEGLSKGVPDLCLAWPAGVYHGMYLEMKSKTGTLRPEQRTWLQRLKAAGYYTAVCRSYEEARDAIMAYLAEEVDPY